MKRTVLFLLFFICVSTIYLSEALVSICPRSGSATATRMANRGVCDPSQGWCFKRNSDPDYDSYYCEAGNCGGCSNTLQPVPSSSMTPPNNTMINPSSSYLVSQSPWKVRFKWEVANFGCCARQRSSGVQSSPIHELWVDGVKVSTFEVTDAMRAASTTSQFFDLDVSSYACGSVHTWKVVSSACNASTRCAARSGNCETTCWDGNVTKDSPTYSFTVDCCKTAPEVTAAPSPTENQRFPADVSNITLNWNVKNTCTASYQQSASNKGYLTPPSPAGLQTLVPPSYNSNLNNNPYSAVYTVAESERCEPVEKSFSWYASASHRSSSPPPASFTDSAPDNAHTDSSQRHHFTIAPDVVTLNSFSPDACYNPGTIAIPSIGVSDSNLINDTVTFRLTGDTTIDSNAVACTSSSCNNVRFNNVPVGTYTMTASNVNNCHAAQTLNQTAAPSQPFSVPIRVGTRTIAGVTASVNVTSDGRFQIVLNIEALGLEVGDSVTFNLQQSNYSGGACSSVFGSIPGGPSQVVCNGSSPTCTSAPFLPSAPGTFCFSAEAASLDPLIFPCGLDMIVSNPIDVYLVNVHAYVDENNTLDCSSNISDGAVKIRNKPVTFAPNIAGFPPEGYQTNTGSSGSEDGVARFGLAVIHTPSPSIDVNFDLSCEGADHTNACVTAGNCSYTYLDCAGPDNSGNYNPVAGSENNLNYSSLVTLTAPTTYDFHLRVGTAANPDDWLTVADGDIFAPGVTVEMCTETSFNDATFDGGIIERPEGSPYTGKDGNPDDDDLADEPYTGGYLFTASSSSSVSDVPMEILTEGNPTHRSIFEIDNMHSSSQPDFMDARFSTFMELYSSGITVPQGISTEDLSNALPGNSISLTRGVYIADSTDDFDNLFADGEYRLTNGDAIIYYTGSSDLNITDLKNISNNDYRLVIISRAPIFIPNTVGYPCGTLSGDPSVSVCGIETTPGSGIIATEYEPGGNSFPANIDATLIALGSFETERPDGTPVEPSDARLLKIKGSVITATSDTTFGRSSGNMSLEYPGEYIVYDQGLLYRLTNWERTEGTTTSGVTGLTSITTTLNYGY